MGSTVAVLERVAEVPPPTPNLRNEETEMYERHFFICTNRRPAGYKESCGVEGKDADAIFRGLVEGVDRHELWYRVAVTSCNCLGPCGVGPSMVVYPEGVWYAPVSLEDVNEIVTEHMLAGRVVERLVYTWPEVVTESGLAGSPQARA